VIQLFILHYSMTDSNGQKTGRLHAKRERQGMNAGYASIMHLFTMSAFTEAGNHNLSLQQKYDDRQNSNSDEI
jgi:hypothetical protein